MSKPSIAELLNASGHTEFTLPLVMRAMYTLYGNIGAGLDERDWSAIMQGSNPLQASEDALRAMYQDSGYLLRNTQHLTQSGYVAAQAEITYRQMANRLGYNYNPAWSDGTAYDYLGDLTYEQLVNLVPAPPPPPPLPTISVSASATGFSVVLNVAGTVKMSVSGDLGNFAAGSTVLAEQDSVKEGFLTLSANGNTSAATSQYVVLGTGGDDTVDFSALASRVDYIFGGAGNDALKGGVGDDVIVGGTGNDTITGGDGADQLTGGSGADVFIYTTRDESYYAGAGTPLDTIADFETGTDKIRFSLSGSVVDASSFATVGNFVDGKNNSIAYSTVDKALYVSATGTSLNNTTAGAYVVSSANAIAAGDLEFVIAGTGGDDVLKGGMGNDIITGGLGADRIDFGASHSAADTVVYTASGETLALSSTTYSAWRTSRTTAGMDVINNAALGDKLQLWNVFSATVTVQTSNFLSNTSANKAAIVRGSWSGTTFTQGITASHDDYLIQWSDGTNVHGVLLNNFGTMAPGLRADHVNDTLTLADTTPPTVSVASISGGNTLTFTSNENGSAQLYAADGSTPFGSYQSIALAANTPASITVAAQATLTAAVLKVSDAADNAASPKVYLGTTGDDAITGTSSNDYIFGFGGNDIITSGAGSDVVDVGAGDVRVVQDQVGPAGIDTITGFGAGDTLVINPYYSPSNIYYYSVAEVQITAAGVQQTLTNRNTYVIEQALGAAGSLTTGSTKTLVAADFTAATLTNLAAFLSERFTGLSSSQTDAFVLNDGTNSYIYAVFAGTASATIGANNIGLTGVISGYVVTAADVLQA